MTKSPTAASMRHLADRYADELGAQYRTLNLLTQHAGEIGRTHEVFLKAILQRFLPGKLRCGTGFVGGRDGVTRQQDIIVFDPSSLPVLYEVGDCIVADAGAVVGTVEVKTRLTSKRDFIKASRQLLETRSMICGGFVALYVWEGLKLESVLDYVWAESRRAKHLGGIVIPDVVYVRGRFFLIPNLTGRRDTPPLRVIRLDSKKRSEGEALLSFAVRMWFGGVQYHAPWPWWIQDWNERSSEVYEDIKWPKDLQERADREQWAAEA